MSTPKLATTGLTLILLTLALMACQYIDTGGAPDEIDPEPRLEALASEIWQEYQADDTNRFANDSYRDQWVIVTLDGVRRDERGEPAGIDAVTGTRLILRTPGNFGTMEFVFRFREDTAEYKRGDRPKVLCNVKGSDLARTKIEFIHCRGEQ